VTIIEFINLLVGSIASRMIGIENINTIQLIALSQAFAPKYYPTIYGLSGLTNVIGGFQNIIINSTIVEQPVEYRRLNYSADFIGNSLLIVIFQMLSLSLYGILILV
jgi:hypothetical protein